MFIEPKRNFGFRFFRINFPWSFTISFSFLLIVVISYFFSIGYTGQKSGVHNSHPVRYGILGLFSNFFNKALNFIQPHQFSPVNYLKPLIDFSYIHRQGYYDWYEGHVDDSVPWWKPIISVFGHDDLIQSKLNSPNMSFCQFIDIMGDYSLETIEIPIKPQLNIDTIGSDKNVTDKTENNSKQIAPDDSKKAPKGPKSTKVVINDFVDKVASLDARKGTHHEEVEAELTFLGMAFQFDISFKPPFNESKCPKHCEKKCFEG